MRVRKREGVSERKRERERERERKRERERDFTSCWVKKNGFHDVHFFRCSHSITTKSLILGPEDSGWDNRNLDTTVY